MPLSPQASRNSIGNYHNKKADYIKDRDRQRDVTRFLAKYPGDPLKRARAELMLQSLLFISNAAGYKNHFSSPAVAQQEKTLVPPSSKVLIAAHLQAWSGERHRYNLTAGADRLANVTRPAGAMAGPVKRNKTHPASAHQINKRSQDGALGHTGNGVKAQTRRLADWLVAKGVTDAGGIAGDDYALINLCIEYVQQIPEALTPLVRELCKPSGDIGGHREEALIESSQSRIFHGWIESVVFQPTVVEFIARALVHQGHDDLEGNLSRHAVPQVYASVLKALTTPKAAEAGNLSLTSGQQLSKTARRFILKNVVLPAMPTLGFYNETEPYAGMDVGGVEWVYLHAGLKLVASMALDAALLSKAELVQLGCSLEELLSAAVIDFQTLFFFDMPAKIFYSRQQRLSATASDINCIFHAANASSIALEAFFAAGEKYKTDHNPVDSLLSALGLYQTRSQLSDDLTQATELFKQQNEDIAAKYAVVDGMLLWQLLENFAPQESDFIASAKVSAIVAQFTAFDSLKYQAVSGHLPRSAYTIGLLPEVDLLVAASAGEKRIFALRPARTGYNLARIDERPELYHELMTDATTARKNPDYQLRVYSDAPKAPVLKNNDDTIETLIDNLVNRHKQRLLAQLHQAGFEETTWEKTQKILLSLIPLYDCVTGIREERREAMVSCLLDVFSFVPVAGRGATLASRFAQRGAMGGIASVRSTLGALAVRTTLKESLSRGGAELVRLAVLPAARELNRHAMIALGVAAIRTLDPGFELMGFTGARALKQLIGVAKVLERRMPVWKKIRAWCELRPAQSFVTPPMDIYQTARLEGINSDLPVMKLAGDTVAGQEIYVRVNPETGEVYGKKYTLATGNILQAVPAPIAKRLRNILEQGLSGRGAPGAGKQFAGKPGRKPYTRITGAHLAAWIENGLSPNPRNMGAFIALRDIAYNQWRRYVHAEGTLTERGCQLLQSYEPDAWNRILNLPPQDQRRILGNIDARALQDIAQAAPSTSNIHPGHVSLRHQAGAQLEILRNHFFAIWEQWAGEGMMDEGRAVALNRLKHCLVNSESHLDLSALNLRSLPHAYPPQVVRLFLSNNRLPSLQGTLPPGLIDLDISYNVFTELPEGLGGTLVKLIAHHNKIKQMSAMISEALAELDVSWNDIASVGPVFNKKLITLRLNHNQLTQLPDLSHLQLKSLYLDHNRLTVLPNLPDTLTILSAVANELIEMPATLSIRLLFLDISFNKLTELPSTWGGRLRQLKADSNLLPDVPFPLPPLLKVFSANNNVITQLPPTWPPKLTSLALADNLISSLAQTTFPPSLETLNLHRNSIAVLMENMPDGLQKIFIAGNRLKTVMTNVPRDLTLIDVSQNLINGRPAHLPPRVQFLNLP